MKTWLKGGLIGVLISLIYEAYLFGLFSQISRFITIFWYLDFIGLFFCKLFGCYQAGSQAITAPISFFIIGALIGLMIQK